MQVGTMAASSSTGAPSGNVSLQDVIAQIHRLHTPSGPHAAQEATQWLMAWSNQCPWESLLALLNTSDPLVEFFASNCLAQKAQSGRNASPQTASQVMECIKNASRNGNRVVVRQLCVAFADLALYGHASLQMAVQELQHEHYAVMLEMLKIFPEEVRSAKVTVDSDQRMRLINELLVSQEQVFDVLAGSDSSHALKLEACEQWLSLPSPQFIAAKESGAKFTAEIIRRKCHEHPLLQLAATLVKGDNLQTAEAACGALIALVQLTNEYNELTQPAITLVAQAVCELANVLSPQVDVNSWLQYGPTSAHADPQTLRMNYVSKLLAELGAHFFRALAAVPPGGTPPPWVPTLGEVALHWLTLRQVELARGGLEFWYACLAALPADDPNGKELLHPWMEKFTHACLKCTRYPPDPEAFEGFETDHFVRFREHCNQCLTEAVATVLPVSWVIHLVGEKIQSLDTWNDLDAAVFILTGVAPRAPAGQDNVIPKLIEYIPRFPYPQVGLPALLLRISAGRLILYTAGYLSFKPDALVPTLKFLLTQLLPSLPAIQCGDKDLKQYSQAICTDALRITTQSAKDKLLELEEGNLWKQIIQQIVDLVLNAGFHPDVRAQMVFSAGHIIGAIKDTHELESTLGEFVKRLEPQYDITNYQAREGKGPPELKLYLAGLSCCYDVRLAEPNASPADVEGTHHPVLSFWEAQWPQIEKITQLAVERDWDDYIEQLCLSLSFIFQSAKLHALSAQSTLLMNSLRLLATAAEHKPNVHYYGIVGIGKVRQIMSLFAPHGIKEVDAALVEFLGKFSLPVAQSSRQRRCEPAITASCFEMLGDALRWSNLANGSLQSRWLPEVFDGALNFLTEPEEIATHEAALTAVLRFFCSFLRWASEGPEVVKYAKPLWENEGRIAGLVFWGWIRLLFESRIFIVGALLKLMVLCADSPKASTVGAIAEVIRPMLLGPMEFEAKTALKEGFGNLPKGLAKNPMESHKLVEAMAIGKVDQRRFHKILYDLVEQFHATLKRNGIQ